MNMNKENTFKVIDREGKEIESNPMLKYWIELIKINLL